MLPNACEPVCSCAYTDSQYALITHCLQTCGLKPDYTMNTFEGISDVFNRNQKYVDIDWLDSGEVLVGLTDFKGYDEVIEITNSHEYDVLLVCQKIRDFLDSDAPTSEPSRTAVCHLDSP